MASKELHQFGAMLPKDNARTFRMLTFPSFLPSFLPSPKATQSQKTHVHTQQCIPGLYIFPMQLSFEWYRYLPQLNRSEIKEDFNILVPRAPTFFFKLLDEGLWDHPKISLFSLAVQNLMRNKVKSATLLRIGLYFR